MIAEHAIVERDGFKVPLIGIAPETVLEECDCCHDVFPIRLVRLVGSQMLCEKCEGKIE